MAATTYTVRCEDGIVKVEPQARLLRKEAAVSLCHDIESEALDCPDLKGLLMGLGALSKATPAAGAYAIRQLKDLAVPRIALVGGNAFIRGLASTVLRLGGFPEHRFFVDETSARLWLSG